MALSAYHIAEMCRARGIRRPDLVWQAWSPTLNQAERDFVEGRRPESEIVQAYLAGQIGLIPVVHAQLFNGSDDLYHDTARYILDRKCTDHAAQEAFRDYLD